MAGTKEAVRCSGKQLRVFCTRGGDLSGKAPSRGLHKKTGLRRRGTVVNNPSIILSWEGKGRVPHPAKEKPDTRGTLWMAVIVCWEEEVLLARVESPKSSLNPSFIPVSSVSGVKSIADSASFHGSRMCHGRVSSRRCVLTEKLHFAHALFPGQHYLFQGRCLVRSPQGSGTPNVFGLEDKKKHEFVTSYILTLARIVEDGYN